jgi:hypothetical protein
VRAFLGVLSAPQVAKLALQALEKRYVGVAIQLDEVSEKQQGPP